jgi:hypothetical protein
MPGGVDAHVHLAQDFTSGKCIPHPFIVGTSPSYRERLAVRTPTNVRRPRRSHRQVRRRLYDGLALSYLWRNDNDHRVW